MRGCGLIVRSFEGWLHWEEGGLGMMRIVLYGLRWL